MVNRHCPNIRTRTHFDISIMPLLASICSEYPVSYTHLDVYKRQVRRCAQMDQDIHQVREENQKEVAAVRTDLGERMEGVYSNLNKIDSKVDKNQQRIDEMHRIEESLREEVDAWRCLLYTSPWKQ